MIGLIERDGARPKLFCRSGQSQDRVSEHIVKGFSHIKLQYFFHFLFAILSQMIDSHILLQMIQLLLDSLVPEFDHIGELFQICFSFPSLA